jgi:hypothetical protein
LEYFEELREESSFCEQKEAKKLHPLYRHQTRPLASNGSSFFASFCSQKEDFFFP